MAGHITGLSRSPWILLGYSRDDVHLHILSLHFARPFAQNWELLREWETGEIQGEGELNDWDAGALGYHQEVIWYSEELGGLSQ